MYSIPSLRGVLSETGPAPATGPFPFYTNGEILTQIIVGNDIYIGGNFTAVGKYPNPTVPRQYIAKISLLTGNIDTTFNTESGFNQAVNSIAFDSSNNLYAAGDFTTYKGTARQRIAKLNPTTAALDTSFDSASGFESTVSSIVLDNSGNIYVGGDFTTYKGTTRQRLAKLNAATADLDTTFDTASGFSSGVRTLFLDGPDNLYVGGSFTSYKGTARQSIAKIYLAFGTAALDTTFNSASGFNNEVNSIVLDSSKNVYVGGLFTTYKGTARQRIAKLSPTNAALNTTFDSASGFNVVSFNSVKTIYLDGSGNIYAGGAFTTYKGIARQGIAKLNPTTAALDTTFDTASGFNNIVRSIALYSSGNFYVGGNFTTYKTFNAASSAIVDSITAAAKGY